MAAPAREIGITGSVSSGIGVPGAAVGRWYFTARLAPLLVRRPVSTRFFSQNCSVRGASFRGKASAIFSRLAPPG